MERWAFLRDFVRDFVAPFVAERAIGMEYHFERDRDRVAIVGQTINRAPGAAPAIRTRAELTPGAGLTEVVVATELHRWHAVRIVERPLAPPLSLVRDAGSLLDRHVDTPAGLVQWP